MKKALVIIPSETASDCHRYDVFRAALEVAGYSASRAPDFFGSRPDVHDLLTEVHEQDLMVCDLTGRKPHVFYYLGLAHALGKRVLVTFPKPEDSPFHSYAGITLLYDPDQPNWPEKVREDVARAVRDLEASHPLRVDHAGTRSNSKSFIRWALSNEIKFNLSEIERVRAKDLVFLGVWHTVERGSFLIVNCETDAFESKDVQRTLDKLDDKSMESLKAVYRGFYEINHQARIADREIAIKTAQEYLKAIREFENSLMDEAKDLVEELVAKRL